MLSLGNKLTLNTQPIYKFVNKYSIDFDGVDDKIVTDGADTVAQNTTYSFWCKSSETSNNLGLFGHGSGDRGAFHLNFSSKPLLELGANYYKLWNVTTKISDGEWHHWVLYVEPNNLNNCKLYCDGILQTVHSTVSSGSPKTYTESLTIGSDRQASGNFFEGKIDEFAVYDRELTQAEITRMYNTYYSPNRVANGNFSQVGNEEVTNGNFGQIGSERVTNGDFATDSNWNINGTFEITNGRLHCISDGSFQYAGQGSVFEVGKTYKLTFDIVDYTSGSIRIRPSGQSPFNTYNANGTYTEYITATDATLLIERNSACDLFVDNVSVKEVGQDWTFGDGWGMGDGIATCDGTQSSASYLLQNLVLPTPNQYLVTFEVSNYSSGNVKFGFSSSTSSPFGTARTANGVYTETFTHDSNTIALRFRASDDFVGDIDNISVREVGQHWTVGGGWTIDGTKASRIAQSGSTSTYQSVSFVAGKTYKIIYDLDISAGEFKIRIGGGTLVDTPIRTTSGTYTETIVANAGNNVLNLRANNGAFVGSVDNIVVQELKHDATNLMINAGAYQSANPLITSTKSMEFDGSDDYLSVSDSDDLDIGTNDFSVSAWVKTTDADGTVMAKRNGSVSGGAGYEMGLSNGKVSYYFKDAAGNAAYDTEDTSTVNDGKWHHIAWVFDRSGLGYRYIDGVNSGTNDSLTGAAGSLANTDVALGMGARIQASADNFLGGKITETGIWNRALTSLEVASLYNQGMPTNLLVNRNNYQSGNPTVFNTKQVDFDGADDHLKVTNAYGSFTGSISFWVNRDDNTGYHYLFDSRGSSGGGVGFAYFHTGTDNLIVSSGTRYVDGVAATVVATDGNWHHIVITGIALNINENITIGTRYSLNDNIDGVMSQVGLWNTTLTADEVSSLYNHGLPIDLTTDQAAYESSSNLVGYWRMGSGTLDTYPLIADQTNATLGSELLSQPVDLQTDFTNNSGGVIVDADTFTTAGGTLDGIVTSISTTIGKTYKLTVEGNTTSSGFTFGSANGTGREYGSGFGTHYFVSLHANIWVRQSTAGTTNITSFTLKQVNGNPAIMTNQTSSDIENGSPYANIVQNGDFNGSSLGWTESGTWAYGNNNEVCTGNGTNQVLTQSGILTNGKFYTYSIDIISSTLSSQEIRVYVGGTDYITHILNGGSETITANTVSAGANLAIRVNSSNTSGILTIDNVTVAETNTGLQGYWKMGDGTNDEYPVIYDQVDPTLGSEIVTNGNFATETDWTFSNVGFSAGAITFDASSDYIFQSFADTVGKTYKIVITKTGVGTPRYRTGYAGTDAPTREIAESGIAYFTATSDTNRIQIYGDANSIDYVLNSVSVVEVQGNPATMTNMVEGNITNQYPLTKIRNYYRMGDGILDGYPIIQDQTSPNLAHIPTTNILTYSEDFSQSMYAKTNATVTGGFASPIGDNNAYKLTASAANGQILFNITSQPISNKSVSIFAKANTSTSKLTIVEQYYFGHQTIFDLNLGVIQSSNGFSSKMENVGNGWYRCTHVQTGYSSGQTNATFAFRSNTADSLFIFGSQLEIQSQATAYLKSDGIAAVRKSSTTNLIPYSEDFENAAWSISELSFGSKVTSPIGTNDAITIIETDATAQHNIYDEIVGFTNEAYTLSCYAKLGTSSNRGIFLRVRDGNTSGTSYGIAWYNLSDGTFTMSGGISANIENVGNGWYRCSLTVTAPSGNSLCLIGLANGNSNYYDGDGTSNVLIWGSQVEKQTQAETYAPTYGLPVTIDLFTENNYGTMTNMSASDIIEDTPNN